MVKKLIQTQDDWSAFVLRLTLGIVMFPHGAQKVLGWFGGYGLSATVDTFTTKMGMPMVFTILAIVAEFLGSIGLITGLLTRIAAFGILSVMSVAVLTVHLQNGFFMNWFGAQRGEGFEYHLLAIGLAIGIMIKGGGACSLDRKFTHFFN